MSVNPAVTRLLLGTAATALGKAGFSVTVSVYAFLYGGASALGLVVLAQTLPALVAAPLLGTAADRLPRQRVVVVTCALRGVAIVAAAAAAAAGLPFGVFACAVAYSVISTANQPARSALLPVLARTPAELSRATAMLGTIDSGAGVFGAGLGGLLLAATSTQAVAVGCAVSFALGALILAGIPTDRRPRNRRATHPLREAAGGFTTVVRDARLRAVVTVLLALFVVEGLVSVLVVVTAIDRLQLGTEGVGYLGRVLSVQESTWVLGLGLGAILAPALVHGLGEGEALMVAGAFVPVVLALRWRTLRSLEDGAPVPLVEFGLVRRNAIFAPLPVATVEELARRLSAVEAAPSVEVVTQGDVGDRFYFVLSGELEVEEDGVFKRTLGAGDSFGEIALLRGVPRTATVRAVTGCVLRALDRDTFLLTVTGQPDSHDAAVERAERLAPLAA